MPALLSQGPRHRRAMQAAGSVHGRELRGICSHHPARATHRRGRRGLITWTQHHIGVPLWFSLILLTLLFRLGQTVPDWPLRSGDVCWVSPRGQDHLAASGQEDSPFFGEYAFFRPGWGFTFSKAGLSQARLAFIFVVFLELIAHSLFSKIAIWKNNSVLPDSFGILFAGCAILSVSYYAHWNGL